MRLFRPIAVTAAVLAGVTLAAPAARADGFNGPFKNGPKYPTFCAWLGNCFNFHKQPQLPVFQAAPWYQYWPYDGHFLTPAPVGGAFYGPPVPGNFPVNPYFAAPAGPYGPVPGGGAPYAPPAPVGGYPGQ